MSTKITVVVGANGETLNALAMRNAARADRLDSEATKKQASQAAVNQLDDGTNGRENKLNKGGVSRDPAAHARKKKQEPVDGFHGMRITFQHTPLSDLMQWRNAEGLNYMTITAQGIGANGGISSQAQVIELKRNLIHPTFRAALPSGLKVMPEYNGNNNGGWAPYPSLYYNDRDFASYVTDSTRKYSVEAVSYFSDVATYLYPNYHSIPDNDYVQVYGTFRTRWQPFNAKAIGPLNGSVALRVYDKTNFYGYEVVNNSGRYVNELDRRGHPDSSENPNTLVNGRQQGDAYVTNRTDEDKDPVYELFMLPFTKEKCFLLIVYTDYTVITSSHAETAGTCTAELSNTEEVRGNNGFGQWVKYYDESGNRVSYNRSISTHHFPEGYEWPDYNWATHSYVGGASSTYPVITEVGSKTIQQIYLYEMVDGELRKIDDDDIPQELRDTCSEHLGANLNGFEVGETGPSESTFHNTAEIDQVVIGNNGGGTISRSSVGTSWENPSQLCPIHKNQFVRDKIVRHRSYLTDNTRDRSIGKAYGLGKLTTYDHFESAYIDSSFLEGFADDYYFTPMVYSYIGGYAYPSLTYEFASRGMPLDPADPSGSTLFQLDRFADYDGNGQIRFIEESPEWINQPYMGETGEWQEVPNLQNSTHRCWNWGRPDICWDALNNLGFGHNLIGDRPPAPTDE